MNKKKLKTFGIFFAISLFVGGVGRELSGYVLLIYSLLLALAITGFGFTKIFGYCLALTFVCAFALFNCGVGRENEFAFWAHSFFIAAALSGLVELFNKDE